LVHRKLLPGWEGRLSKRGKTNHSRFQPVGILHVNEIFTWKHRKTKTERFRKERRRAGEEL